MILACSLRRCLPSSNSSPVKHFAIDHTIKPYPQHPEMNGRVGVQILSVSGETEQLGDPGRCKMKYER
jgi:hypothetical protein